MKLQEKSLIYSYIYNHRINFERAIEEAQSRIRFRNVSETECIELALLKERYNSFMEFSGHILALLKLNSKPKGNTCIICGSEIPEGRQVCHNCYKRYKGE